MNIIGSVLKQAVFQPRSSYYSIVFQGSYIVSSVEAGLLTFETIGTTSVSNITLKIIYVC